MSTLYLVATPIGNLADITLRAIETLKSVTLIAAEDTRITQKLLTHYQIHNRMISLYDQNEARRIPLVLEALQQGDVALVSDSGTPALNDPGFKLVNAAIRAGHRVSPIPGPCAPIAALVASGLPTDRFLYLGFLPRKSTELKQVLEAISSLPYTLLALETPHRLAKSLELLSQVLGDRQIVIAREMTKLHEEFWRGTLSQAVAVFSSSEQRGEITLVIEGASQPPQKWSEDHLLQAIQEALEKGLGTKELAQELAKVSGWQSKEIYQKALSLKPRQF
ncbi:MAG: 16S rRNA (cytidine(1402)-2'-O)-methyltransferase [Anaerolineales bacterium]|nr:16S rRNA (cytidine(1402)-2'-O)-methyltransferase [Anaerolineales bacterium]MCS7246942.1 16S rRNA (cytidine(1402)-2'-O)-methyltransferase [Anaerolineales bacterium]MDW8160753.1 16S rRNA (cytidine(1402)-2'-O)-methyltransferase [Anaerolineales bacterium]MDW8447676.1 16S rRNA (cytidine(1402)-2'-O)-methyltransferase [Anaerolineales bacterium]